MDATKKRILIYVAIGLVAVIVIGSVIAMSINRDEPLSVDELLRLGEKYLLDLDYEQALAQFLRVIEIEPMNPHGYTGAAEAYMGLGNTENAIAILQQGNELIDDESIALKLEQLIQPEEASSEPKTIDFKPFTLLDLEKIGMPWGMTIYDLEGKYGVTGEDIQNEVERINQIIVEYAEEVSLGGYHTGNSTVDPLDYFDIGISPEYHLKVLGTLISLNDFSGCPVQNWPRGIKPGMALSDVFSEFSIPGSHTQQFLQNPTRATLIALGAEERNGGSYLLLQDSIDVEQEGRLFTTRFLIEWEDDARKIEPFDLRVVVSCIEGDKRALLMFESLEGVVQTIEVRYMY